MLELIGADKHVKPQYEVEKLYSKRIYSATVVRRMFFFRTRTYKKKTSETKIHKTQIVFTSPEPLGSQGELIVYPWIRRPPVVRPSS